MKIRTWLNKAEHTTKGKVFTQPSKTIPDQTMSIQEILKRHAHGLPLGGSQEGLYDEDGDSQGIDIRTLDLVDIQAMKIANKKYLSESEEYLKNKKKQREEFKNKQTEAPEGH